MKNASAPVRLVFSLLTIGALFFGIAAVALNFGGDEAITADQEATSTGLLTPSTATLDELKPAESPKPSLDRVVTDPAAGSTAGPTADSAADPTLDIPTTTMPRVTSTSSAKSAPTTSVPPKPTTTDAPATTEPPPGAPADAITVNPGDNIQSLVESHPEGTTFFLRSGLHKSPGGTRHVDPKRGDTFIGESGAVMDGGGNTTFAFQDNKGASGVTIRGIEIRNYSTPAQRGAIDAGSGGWRVVGNEIHHNTGAGVSLGGSNWVIEKNNIHHNRQIGIKGQGSGGRVVSNTIANNNPDRAYDWSWEAGGTKFIKTTNLYVAGNKVLNNMGPGLWTDGDNRGTVYEKNTVRDNAGPGIFHEISFSATIRNNTVTGNAHPFYVGGILIANSSGVTVTGNTLSGNDGGIIGLQDSRGGYNTVDLIVTGNSVSHSIGGTGLAYNSGTDVAASGTIKFDKNSYSVGGSRPFLWKGGARTVAEWQALGQDTNSTFS